MSSIEAIFRIAAFIALGGIALVDVQRRIVPNKLVVVVAGLGIALRLLAGGNLIWFSLMTAAGVFLVLGFIAHAGMIGGGDVKLIPAATLLVAPLEVPNLLLAIAIAGGLLSLGYLASEWRQKASALSRASRARNAALSQHEMTATAEYAGTLPYAVAVFGGCAFQLANEGLTCFYAISCSH